MNRHKTEISAVVTWAKTDLFLLFSQALATSLNELLHSPSFTQFVPHVPMVLAKWCLVVTQSSCFFAECQLWCTPTPARFKNTALHFAAHLNSSAWPTRIGIYNPVNAYLGVHPTVNQVMRKEGRYVACLTEGRELLEFNSLKFHLLFIIHPNF